MKLSLLNIILHRLASFLLFFLVINTLASKASADIRNFQTTRMKSTGSTGVGAILFEDATFLNPAPLGFYNASSIYFQKVDGTRQQEHLSGGTESQELDSTAFILTDAGGALKGSFSYIKQNDSDDKREQFGVSFGKLISEKSSLGASLLVKKDLLNQNTDPQRREYKQAIFGLTHILSENLSFGLSLIDPFRSNEVDSKVIIGAQYIYKDFISLMLDLGSDYKNDLSQKYVVRGASQIRFLDDFFLRFGAYRDLALQEKGNGIGLSWVTPKLSVDIARNSVKAITSNDQINAQDLSEFTFSLSLQF